jgi:hypothetical protein
MKINYTTAQQIRIGREMHEDRGCVKGIHTRTCDSLVVVESATPAQMCNVFDICDLDEAHREKQRYQDSFE